MIIIGKKYTIKDTEVSSPIILDMLNNKKATIEEIFVVIKEKKYFDGKIATFRQRISEDFKIISIDGKEKYVYVDPYKDTLVDPKYSTQVTNNNSIPLNTYSNSSELPPNFEDNLNEAKEKLSNSLSNNSSVPNIQEVSDESTTITLDKLNKNIHGIMFKIDWMEHKIKQLDKKINEIHESKELESQILKVLINILNPRLFDDNE